MVTFLLQLEMSFSLFFLPKINYLHCFNVSIDTNISIPMYREGEGRYNL